MSQRKIEIWENAFRKISNIGQAQQLMNNCKTLFQKCIYI